MEAAYRLRPFPSNPGFQVRDQVFAVSGLEFDHLAVGSAFQFTDQAQAP
jgi:hypothetical protein